MRPLLYTLKLFILALTLVTGLQPLPVAAQHCLLLPLDPAERAQKSTLVVEAEVLDARSFWDASHRRLFTRHRLRVFSLFKGSAADTAGLVLVTEGGRLGLDQQTLTNTLSLEPGQQGVLFLSAAPWPGLNAAGPGRLWTAYGSQQGFITYNLADNTAAEPFRQYPFIGPSFYQQLSQLTGQPRKALFPNITLAAAQFQRGAQRRTQAPSITGLQPTQLTAGTDAVLTIQGSEFGTSRGLGFVEFRNADDGGATWVKARESDYLSWTSTQVQVRVPSSGSGQRPAGSGRVRLTTNSQLQTESPGAITIVYALTNVENTDGSVLVRPNHVARNDSGGFTFRFGPSFLARPAAVAAWSRALATWRCHSGINWSGEGNSGTDAIADDDQNTVAFDNASNPLPAQVLGRTTSYYRGCYDASRQVIFWVKEIDMQFDDATSFQFGPLPAVGQVDFETVVLHELGHAQQLTHLILPGAVMHYAIAPSRNARTLNPASDVAGGRKVLRERSFQRLGCGGPALLPAPLTRFNAEFAGGVVRVAWGTRDECFLTGFTVERSTGADTSRWEGLSSRGSGQGSSYAYVDAQPQPGLRYYRLGLQRPDGSTDHTQAVPVSSEDGAPSATIFPNPVPDNLLQLLYPATTAGNLSLEVFDELGRRHRRVLSAAQVGMNVLSVDVSGLSAGFYILRWRDEQGQQGSRRFVRL